MVLLPQKFCVKRKLQYVSSWPETWRHIGIIYDRSLTTLGDVSADRPQKYFDLKLVDSLAFTGIPDG